MCDEYSDEVQAIVGPQLTNLGFHLDSVDDHVDEGGRRGGVIYYRRADCGMQIYWSAREFEINAMIAPLDAPNEYGLYNKSGKWHYLAEFVKKPDLPLEELVKVLKADRENFVSTTKWLTWLRDKIVVNFPAAHDGIKAMDR